MDCGSLLRFLSFALCSLVLCTLKSAVTLFFFFLNIEYIVKHLNVQTFVV